MIYLTWKTFIHTSKSNAEFAMCWSTGQFWHRSVRYTLAILKPTLLLGFLLLLFYMERFLTVGEGVCLFLLLFCFSEPGISHFIIHWQLTRREHAPSPWPATLGWPLSLPLPCMTLDILFSFVLLVWSNS